MHLPSAIQISGKYSYIMEIINTEQVTHVTKKRSDGNTSLLAYLLSLIFLAAEACPSAPSRQAGRGTSFP